MGEEDISGVHMLKIYIKILQIYIHIIDWEGGRQLSEGVSRSFEIWLSFERRCCKVKSQKFGQPTSTDEFSPQYKLMHLHRDHFLFCVLKPLFYFVPRNLFLFRALRPLSILCLETPFLFRASRSLSILCLETPFLFCASRCSEEKQARLSASGDRDHFQRSSRPSGNVFGKERKRTKIRELERNRKRMRNKHEEGVSKFMWKWKKKQVQSSDLRRTGEYQMS